MLAVRTPSTACLFLAVALACQPGAESMTTDGGESTTGSTGTSTAATTAGTTSATSGSTAPDTGDTGAEPTTGATAGSTGETGSGTSTDATTGELEPFTVYIDPSGDDAHGGLSPADAIVTLARAQEIVAAAAPDRDVEVRISQGTYVGQSVSWTYYHPQHRVSFMPVDYDDGDGVDDIAGRPVFDGDGAGSLFSLDVDDGAETRIEFYFLRVERYLAYGIRFHGDRDDPEGGWNGGNRVFGMYFTEIGSLHVPGAQGYGALDLVNTRNNDIRNNHFVAVENDAQTAGRMHGVYLAHHSSGNQIRDNRFTGVSGDPIRARDDSNANIITDNFFKKTGVIAYYSDWYCDPADNPDCTKPGGECPSWENEFRDNTLQCGHDGADIPAFAYIQGGADYLPPGCPDHFADGWKRLYTSGNIDDCP